MERHKNSNVVILEIGAGFNTPTVTRFPMESYARALGNQAHLIRINPSDPEVPEDLSALALAEGWQVLGDILKSQNKLDTGVPKVEESVRGYQYENDLMVPNQVTAQYKHYFRHFEWRHFLEQLRDRHH